MKITLGLNSKIQCPFCSTKPTVTTGFWGSLLVSAVLDRLAKKGGVVTCQNCHKKYEVKGK